MRGGLDGGKWWGHLTCEVTPKCASTRASKAMQVVTRCKYAKIFDTLVVLARCGTHAMPHPCDDTVTAKGPGVGKTGSGNARKAKRMLYFPPSCFRDWTFQTHTPTHVRTSSAFAKRRRLRTHAPMHAPERRSDSSTSTQNVRVLEAYAYFLGGLAARPLSFHRQCFHVRRA